MGKHNRRHGKQAWSVLLICFLVIHVLFLMGQACAQQKYNITFHTGAVGGLYMEPAVVWAEMWRQRLPGVVVSPILGGSFTNPAEVSRATDPNAVMGIADSIAAYEAWTGTGEYEKRAPSGLKNLRALYKFNVKSYGHVIARPEAVPEGIETLGDLLALKPALRWAFKIRGSGDEIFAGRLLKEYGVTYDDLKAWGGNVSFNNPVDIASLLIDGHADITIAIVRAPASYILDMDASIPSLKWLKIEDNILDSMIRYGYTREIHPAEYYSTLKEPFNTTAFDHIVFVQKDMDEELAYNLTKIVLEDPERIRKAVPALGAFDPKVAWRDTGFPLHPGAERAYRELGLMK